MNAPIVESTFTLPLCREQPAFPVRDSRSCQDWLTSAPLLNVPLAQRQLRDLLHGLNGTILPAADRLKILEKLYEAITMVQDSQSRKYAGKPIPLLPEQQVIWQEVQALWRELLTGYWLVLDEAASGSPEALEFGVFAGQRALIFLAAWHREHYVIDRVVPNDGWVLMYELYRVLESAGWTRKQVKALGRREGDMGTPEAACCHALLLNLANPNQLNPRQLLYVDQLLGEWAGKAHLMAQLPPESRLAVVALDLGKQDAPYFVGQSTPGSVAPRYLMRDKLVAWLGKQIKSLRAGATAESIGMADATGVGGVGFLTLLYRAWSEKSERSFPRQTISAEVGLGNDWSHIYSYLTGTLFQPVGQKKELSASNMSDFALFGRRSDETFHSGADHTIQLPPLEDWQVLDESANGLRLSCSESFYRWQQQQVVLLRRGLIGERIAVVRRLHHVAGRHLELGVQIIPGDPMGVIAYPTGVQALVGQPQPAVLLPEVSAIRQVASLITPTGTFVVDKIIDIKTNDAVRRYKLSSLIERGANFERFTVEIA